ncbi:hypothetical protein [Patiriisocius sp. Uisw_017]|jgi:hypothetical protein|uniref:hypothetical protein n=1 Tax=Patiriisocius sp. Uisw_017 TaxID=3230968 RepID=UPI0039ED0E4D
MPSMDIRNTIQKFISTAGIRLLKMIKALAESYQNDEQELMLHKEQYALTNQREEAHLKGKSESFTWQQVRQNGRNTAK